MVDPASLRKEWKELFSSMDTDQSGNITCIELYRFIVKVAKMENNGENAEVKWDDVKKIFKSLDKDGDRSIEWEEFFVNITRKDRFISLNYVAGCCNLQGKGSAMEEVVGKVKSEKYLGEDIRGRGEEDILLY